MSDQEKIEAIRRIKKTHENFVVFGGILIGVILSVYFFSFSTFLDKAPALAYFQVVTFFLLVAGLFYIRHVAYFLTRLKLGPKPVCKALLEAISVADIGKDEEALLELTSKGSGHV